MLNEREMTKCEWSTELRGTGEDHTKVRDIQGGAPRDGEGTGLLYNTNFSRGGNVRYIRELGFCAKFTSREIFLPAKIKF